MTSADDDGDAVRPECLRRGDDGIRSGRAPARQYAQYVLRDATRAASRDARRS
jgi:hypothetical protein